MNNAQVDAYINSFPQHISEKLTELRNIISSTAPEAKEVISYSMPAYKRNGMLVYFAGYKNHIGFYPTASGIKEFESEFNGLKHSKGAVQFPIDQPLPKQLIIDIVNFRLKEDGLKKPKSN